MHPDSILWRRLDTRVVSKGPVVLPMRDRSWFKSKRDDTLYDRAPSNHHVMNLIPNIRS